MVVGSDVIQRTLFWGAGGGVWHIVSPKRSRWLVKPAAAGSLRPADPRGGERPAAAAAVNIHEQEKKPRRASRPH